jgi:predicted CopG family antitoxin
MCAATSVGARKNVNLSEDTYDRLKTFGKFGESFDDLMNRLMDNMESGSKDD